MKKFFISLVIGSASVSAQNAQAHSNIHHQLHTVTQSIERKASAELLTYRADLLIRLKRFEEALLDLAIIESRSDFQSSLNEARVLRAKIYFLQRKYDGALQNIAKIKATSPQSSLTLSKALQIESLIYAAQQKAELSALSSQKSLEAHPRPEPDLYLTTAALYEKLSPAHSREILRAGILRFGHLPSLTEKLISLFESDRNFEAALSLIKEYILTMNRKEHWLLRQALIEIKIKDQREALNTFKEAELAISKLPSHINLQSETLSLRSEIQNQLSH